MILNLPNNTTLDLTKPNLAAIINLTPDSFSDGGRLNSTQSALEHTLDAIHQGADIVDVGGESTRPGASRISPDQQIKRTIPFITELAQKNQTPISIDTTRLTVARAALNAGATIINDISAGEDSNNDTLRLAADTNTPIILMHKKGAPQNMQQHPTYGDVTHEVLNYLMDRAQTAQSLGVPQSNIIIDPGFGFGKTHQHNLTLLANLHQFTATPYPVLFGASRKSTLGHITQTPSPTDRDYATAATTALAVAAGVQIIRVHNIPPNRHAADVTRAVLQHQTQHENNEIHNPT